jgi:hypothetical protein
VGRIITVKQQITDKTRLGDRTNQKFKISFDA